MAALNLKKLTEALGKEMDCQLFLGDQHRTTSLAPFGDCARNALTGCNMMYCMQCREEVTAYLCERTTLKNSMEDLLLGDVTQIKRRKPTKYKPWNLLFSKTFSP